MKNGSIGRRKLLAAGLGAAAAAVALAFVPAAAESTAQDHLQVHVVPNNHGPLPACSQDGSDCGSANTVRHFIYVRNENQLPNTGVFRSRPAVSNAFVVSSVDEAVSVDGVELTRFTLTPPPDAFFRAWSGHWPSTATCPPSGDPCNVIESPAVLPGENTVVVYTGWIHGSAEPDGQYVFTYTVHGTLNGMPVDLVDSAPPISMTR